MRVKTLRKFAVFPILLLLIVGLFAFIIPSVSAVSAETTGLQISNFNENQDNTVSCGGWDIVSGGTKIMFFSQNTGSLDKTLNVPLNQGVVFATRLQYWNTTHIIMGTCDYYSGGNQLQMQAYYVNIGTLALTQIGTIWTQNGLSGGGGDNFNMFTNNGNVYCLYGAHGSSNYGCWLKKLTPDTAPVSLSTDTTKKLIGSTIIIPSNTLNTIYVLSESNTGTARYQVYKIDCVTPTYTQIGTSPTDNVWGDFVYYFAKSYDTCGASSWYDIGVCYNIKGVNQNLAFAIIRFNDTAIEVNYRSTLSATSAVNILRPFSVSYTGIWDRTSLREGDYQFYYYGTSYGAMLCPVTVGNLSTTIPTTYITYNPSVYGDNGVQWVNYYTSANSVGGLLLPSGNNIMLDYQNNKGINAKWASLNPSYSYVFSVSPQALHLIGSGTTLRAVCMLGQQYTYNGEVFADGVRIGNGTYTVSSTGLSTNYNIATQGTYGTTSTTGVISNGLLSFTMSARTSAYVTIYEGIKVSININGGTQDFIHTFVWTSDTNEDGLQPSTAPTIPPNGNGGGNTNGGMGGTSGVNLLNGSTFVGLFITIFFAVFFLVVGGRDGLFAGLMLGIFLSCLFGFFPVYGYILVAVFGALLLFSHVSLGGGLSLGKQGNSNNGE